MADTEHLMEVADEQAANRRYLREMQRKVERRIPIAVSRSALWTGSGLPAPTEPVVGPLVGRVGLDVPDAGVGARSFYIGPWHVDDDGLVVYSWAAPVAAAFYATGGSGYQLDADVVVRRTMSIEQPGHAVADFFDEWLDEAHGSSPFAASKPLSIPQAPPSARRPSTPTASPPKPRQSAEVPLVPDPRSVSVSTTAGSKRVVGLRAEAAVRAALAAPRGSALPTLLATLQPDQYDYVTRAVDLPLVVQGHPGTGKTVVAAHRAAYLVHPERNRDERPPRVLLLGPNQAYADHVAGVMKSLTVHNPISVMGVGQFLSSLRRLTIQVTGPMDGEHYEVSIDLGDFAEAAAHELRTAGQLMKAKNHQDVVRTVYEALRANAAAGVMLTDDPDWVRYLRKLPNFNTAATSRRFLPLLAQCAISAVPMPSFSFDHVIVDEAQDIRPLEWRLIRAVNPTGSWTLLGDMNQRRSDWSYHSWTHVVRDIGLIDEEASFEPDVFKRGYRSTGPIIAFANHLLPRAERSMENIQTVGPEPTVQRVASRELADAAIAAALELRDRHPLGTVAIITVDRKPIGRALLRQGWTVDPQARRKLAKGDSELHLLTPDAARGLEFDAVVVVEPDAFPPNLGRMGSLYTSLTRANKELAVIFSTRLPDGLRDRRTTPAR